MIWRIVLVVAIVVLGSATVQAAIVNIDTFSTTDGLGSVTDVSAVGPPGGAPPGVSNGQLNTGLTPGLTIGGQRLTRSHMLTGGVDDRNRVRNNSSLPYTDTIVLSQDTGVQGHFHLYYGYNTYNGPVSDPIDASHGFNNMSANLDPLTNTRIRLEVITADQTGGIRIKLVSNHVGLTANVAEVTKGWTGAVTNFELSYNFSQFAGIDFNDIDQIVIESLDFTSADMAFDNIQAVPEPGALAMFGSLGVVGAIYGWRRRKKKSA